MKMTQAWGWLVAAVLAAGLNASYHDGGLQWAHQIADRVEQRSTVATGAGHRERQPVPGRGTVADGTARERVLPVQYDLGASRDEDRRLRNSCRTFRCYVSPRRAPIGEVRGQSGTDRSSGGQTDSPYQDRHCGFCPGCRQSFDSCCLSPDPRERSTDADDQDATDAPDSRRDGRDRPGLTSEI